MSTPSINSTSSRTYETARFVSDHSPKALFAGWVGLCAPGVAAIGAATVFAISRGKISAPLAMLNRPHVERSIELMMRRSVAVMFVSATTSIAADSYLKEHSRALWRARMEANRQKEV